MPKRSAGLSRRRFLATGAAAFSALQLSRIARAAGPARVCTLIPEQEIGPFFLDTGKLRSDVTEGKKGVPLVLQITLQDSRNCAPVANAAIDIWQCDAHGLYSGFTKAALGPPPGEGPGHRGPPGDGPEHQRPPQGFDPEHLGPPPAMHPSDQLTFLRGVQLTDTRGSVQFRSIVPGFYQGRVNHIHFKVRTEGKSGKHSHAAGHTSHVGQVFFPEELAAELMRHPPYSEHKIHRTTAGEDGIFQGEHGQLSVAKLTPIKGGPGIFAELAVAIDPTATPEPVGMRAPPPRNKP